MIKRTINRQKGLICCLIFFLSCGTAFAQKSDWGIWSVAGVKADLSPKWQLEGNIEYRLKENASKADQYRASAGINYNLIKYVKLSTEYQLISDYKKKGGNEYRNRFSLMATGSYKLAGFTASLRSGAQATISNAKKDKEELDNEEWVYRNRLGLKYKIPKTEIQPYISFETFHRLSQGTDPSHYKDRYAAGIEYDFNDHHEIDLGYRRDNETKNSEDYTFDALYIGYTFSF